MRYDNRNYSVLQFDPLKKVESKKRRSYQAQNWLLNWRTSNLGTPKSVKIESKGVEVFENVIRVECLDVYLLRKSKKKEIW